jgi:hypothetical protein
MIKSKLFVGCLLVALVVLLAPASHAQTFCPAPNNTVQCPVVAVGSSAAFPSAGIAAVSGDPITHAGPLCGVRFWTGAANGKDARAAVTLEEGGNLWVAWDNDTTPTIVCTYLSVDSVVGQRLFFGQNANGNGTLDIPTAACTQAARGKKVAFAWDDATNLPVKVWDALMGANATLANCSDATSTNPVHFNVAFTDVRAEDARYVAAQRVLCTDSNTSPFNPPDDKSCLGFGPGTPVGTAVSSSFSGASSNSVAYNITGNDPINTQFTIPTFQQQNVGAQAVLVFVNTIDLSTAGFGTLTAGPAGRANRLTNANSHELSAFYSGSLFFTADLLGANPSLGLPNNIVHVLAREPYSGTYTTFEWQVVRQRDGRNDFSQETGVCGPSQGAACGYTNGCFPPSATWFPGVACSNPMSYLVAGTPALRTRVIGTGQMVSVANTNNWVTSSTNNTPITPSILGYAFWSIGSFGGKSNIKWLTLDGSDPLLPGYSVADGGEDGQFPLIDTVNQGVNPNGITVPVNGCGGYFNSGGIAAAQAFTCNGYTLPTFDNIQNGNYRAWNIMRAVYYGASAQTPSTSPLNVTGFIQGAQDQTAPVNPIASRIPDFFPVAYCNLAACATKIAPMNVFRSHYGVGGFIANNGITTVIAGPESGGDVAGSVFSVQAETDTGLGFSNNSFLTYVQ